ncbi:MAG: hypothetical protein ACKVPJ_08345, partial [Chitinophagales bacterium]
HICFLHGKFILEHSGNPLTKKIFSVLAFLLSCNSFLQAQVFWTEAFGSGPKNTSVDALDSGNGPWDEIAIGSQGSNANSWFASKEECGNAAGTCGSTCPTDASLHVGSVSIGFCSGGDCGAAYLASSTSKTEKEAISPDISTAGYGGITLSFNYIGYGEGTQDVASWSYSCNGGSSWTFVTNLTTNCCTSGGAATGCTSGSCGLFGCQGRWTSYSYSLPSCADDISNFKIKFTWKNDSDNNGNDPSFAVDDITLSASVLPVELVVFTAQAIAEGYEVQWVTQTEINSDHFVLERSFDGEQFISIGHVVAAGNSLQQRFYEFRDDYFFSGTRYYRLKQVDTDESFKYSNIISVQGTKTQNYFVQQTSDQLILTSVLLKNSVSHFELNNISGSKLASYPVVNESTSFAFDLQNIPPGFYILDAKDTAGNSVLVYKFVSN